MSATTTPAAVTNGSPPEAANGKPRRPAVLTVEDAAEFLRVTPETVHLEAAGGRLPARQIGGEWRFSRRGLLRWLDAAEPATVPQWATLPPREWDEAAERELQEELALMAKLRKEWGPANPDAAALDAADAAAEARKAS